ncbi:MAG: HD domain-containing protein [Candidatus Omnitrophica bacterium]|nr:HD domain-containing protein [Candidatus Omnitrophota bacterium]
MMREAYLISSMLTILTTLFLGGMIFFKGRGGRVVQAYFMLMANIALWAAGTFNMVSASSPSEAIIWVSLYCAFAIFIPAFYFRFIMRMLSFEKTYSYLVWAGYILSAAFAVLSAGPFDYICKGSNLNYEVYWPVAGEYCWAFVVYFVSYPILAHIIALRNYNRLTHLAKKQLRYVSIAAVLGFGAGTFSFLPAYGVFLPRLESMAAFFIPFACTFIAIAIYTARLMDIELLKRRTLIFSLLYGMIVGTFVSIVFIMQNVIEVKYHINRFIFPISAIFVIAIFIRPLEHFLAAWTDKFLYQRKYNYQNILENAGKGMLFIVEVDRLVKLIVGILTKHMRITNVSIYLYNKDSGYYERRASRKIDSEVEQHLNPTNALIDWMKEKKSFMLMDDITNWLQKEAIFPHKLILKRTLEQLRVSMRSLKATACVPAFIKQDMIGFLVLGSKLSGAGYTKDDMSLLTTLANSAAVAIENARMYGELNEQIKKIARLLNEQHEVFMDTATAFSYAVDLRDTYSRQHTQRIIEYCMIIIKGLEKMNAGFSRDPDFLENLKIAALLHDVGKVAIPDSILNKEGQLTPEERAVVKNHINIAVKILAPIQELTPVIRIIRYHHEFFDGTGYPDGLKSDEIPFASRVLSVANAYDAMISDRPYRKAMTHQKAAERLKDGVGKDFDPLIVEALLVGFEGIGSTIKGEARTSRGEMPPVLY